LEHTQLITSTDLESYANTRESESVIPELIYLLIKESARDDLAACRIPYGDAINQPGWDGLVETAFGFRQFIPKKKSYWEIGTGANPQTKATRDFTKRTRATSPEEREAATYVFVTPHGAGSGGWNQPAQDKWIRRRRNFKWQSLRILDAVQLADWIRDFPAIGKWLLKKMGLVKTTAGFSTPAEHWENLLQLSKSTDPPIPAKLFLIGRDQALTELERLFQGETSTLVLGIENDSDADDFVAAFLSSLDDQKQQDFGNRCLFVRDAESWISIAKLKTSHVLIAHPTLDLESSGEQLHMEAAKNKHSIVIPVSSGWTSGIGTIVQLRSPSAHMLEATFTEAGYTLERARELGAAGALSLAALKRHLRGLGDLPPYATWENARALAQAGLLGRWSGQNPADRAAMEIALGKTYGEWIETVRPATLRPDTPLTQNSERWKMLSRGESWAALGPQLTDDDLNRFRGAAIIVLSERDPKFDLPAEKRFAAQIHGRALKHSSDLRYGIAETLALLGSRSSALTMCSPERPESIAIVTVRELLNGLDWIGWASLDTLLPLLAEAAPEQFLTAVETATLNLSITPFRELFAQERSGVGGQNLMTGLLWALETLAWERDYLTRVIMILADLAEIDPGGNWANRPANSIVDIVLPWYPQTCASHANRLSAVEALLREHPNVGWKVVLALLPTMHGVSMGTRKPAWRQSIPTTWSESVKQSDYATAVSDYAELAIEFAASDLVKLAELVDYLPNLPKAVQGLVLERVASPMVTGLSESGRQALWESLIDLAAKHRKFAGAHWAMPIEVVEQVEKVAAKIVPTRPTNVHRRLFSDRDFQLFEEKGDYEEQRRRLDLRRTKAIEEILAAENVSGVLDFVHNVPSPAKVGYALGSLDDPSIDQDLLPEYLDATDQAVSAVVAAFVATRFWKNEWAWVDSVVTPDWSVEKKIALLILIPASKETYRRAEELLGADATRYWQRAGVNPWAEKDDVIVGVAKLLQNGRPLAALNALAMLIHQKATFPPELAVRTLLALLNEETGKADYYDVLALIKWLQECPVANSDSLLQIEWAYLPWLIREEGAEPRTLERAMAQDPKFFFEIIRRVFRSKKKESNVDSRTDAEKTYAQNAFRLLHGWRTVPGTLSDGSFDGESFTKWLTDVKHMTEESGHLDAAMGQVGEVLASTPPDPTGLWINSTIAEALDSKDAARMRSGFMRGRMNLRGVYWGTGGAEELNLAADYRAKADALDNSGYPRFAGAVRDLAKSYEWEARREAEEDKFDD
jgi:hypothetical protein